MQKAIIVEQLYVPDMVRYELQCEEIDKVSKQSGSGFEREFSRLKTGAVFFYERWSANQFGTASWTMVVAKAVKKDSVKLPGIYPWCQLLVQAVGKAQVGKLKRYCGKAVTHYGSIKDVPEGHWHRVQSVLPRRSFSPLIFDVPAWCSVGGRTANEVSSLAIKPRDNGEYLCKECGKAIRLSRSPDGKIMVPRHKVRL